MAAEILDIRNPNDLTNTYNQIEIQGSANSDMSSPTTLTSSLAIDTSTAHDLSMGYTAYTDDTGYAYYRFRYKASASGAVSGWSDIYAANTTIMHTRFRRRMRDTNSANYFFPNTDLDTLLANAISKLWPRAYNEVIDESLTTLADTEKYNYPIGINRVNEIEFINSNGETMGEVRNYKKRARQIIFDTTPPTGYMIRLYADKAFKKFAEVPELFDDLILDLMCLEAYQTFEADRSRYYRYTTVTNPEGGNLPSIARVIERLEITTKNRLNELKRVRRATEIHLT